MLQKELRKSLKIDILNKKELLELLSMNSNSKLQELQKQTVDIYKNLTKPLDSADNIKKEIKAIQSNLQLISHDEEPQ